MYTNIDISNIYIQIYIQNAYKYIYFTHTYTKCSLYLMNAKTTLIIDIY